ncbi:hypothetical protein BN873_p40005 [Candidatus Competibacter denitrificans Run_A_D11]|uniref:Uncharacterized protein n=1 Tax=Candidatus Competibacter denitrificans Run_A_D11 TaxID=1400863 RepID=W6MD79_9GAMM|nr:hypothetical protein BN873_p40005 [Candidatus Competibacter denitrificans Run_A_D11]
MLGAKRRTTSRIKPTSGEKACGFLALRGLSAAPLGRSTARSSVYSNGYTTIHLNSGEQRCHFRTITQIWLQRNPRPIPV